MTASVTELPTVHVLDGAVVTITGPLVEVAAVHTAGGRVQLRRPGIDGYRVMPREAIDLILLLAEAVVRVTDGPERDTAQAVLATLADREGVTPLPPSAS